MHHCIFRLYLCKTNSIFNSEGELNTDLIKIIQHSFQMFDFLPWYAYKGPIKLPDLRHSVHSFRLFFCLNCTKRLIYPVNIIIIHLFGYKACNHNYDHNGRFKFFVDFIMFSGICFFNQSITRTEEKVNF